MRARQITSDKVEQVHQVIFSSAISSTERFRRFKNLLRSGPNLVILLEHRPAHSSSRVKEKLGRPRDVLAIFSGAGVDEVVAADCICFRIGKKSECLPGFLRKVARDLRRVYTDPNRTNPDLMELIQALLNAPQLGVA